MGYRSIRKHWLVRMERFTAFDPEEGTLQAWLKQSELCYELLELPAAIRLNGTTQLFVHTPQKLLWVHGPTRNKETCTSYYLTLMGLRKKPVMPRMSSMV